MKITALTSCCVDIYPDIGEINVGGNSLNFATQCCIAGEQAVSVIGAVGNDEHGKQIDQHLRSWSIDHFHLHKLENLTASNKIYINEYGDRYFKADSWDGGAFDSFRLKEQDWELVNKSDIIAMPAGDPNLEDLLERRRNQLVIIDFLDYLGIDFLEKHIHQIDIACISTSRSKLDSLAEISRKAKKIILATLRSEGSWAFHGKESIYQEALPAEKIVDTTGCGDAFQASFVIDWYKNWNLKQALRAAAKAARSTLVFKGGVPKSIPQ